MLPLVKEWKVASRISVQHKEPYTYTTSGIVVPGGLSKSMGGLRIHPTSTSSGLPRIATQGAGGEVSK